MSQNSLENIKRQANIAQRFELFTVQLALLHYRPIGYHVRIAMNLEA